jgi:Tim17/Tim22/Tim23/Pmp24 family
MPPLPFLALVLLLLTFHGVLVECASVLGIEEMSRRRQQGGTRPFSSAGHRNQATVRNVSCATGRPFRRRSGIASVVSSSSSSGLYPTRTHWSTRQRSFGRRRQRSIIKCTSLELYRSHGAIFASTAQISSRPSAEQSGDVLTYDDLGLVGKTVAGAVEIAMAIAIEYCTGFVSGYFLGAVCGLPELARGNGARATFWKEVTGRTSRMHGKGVRWAKSFSSISATFAGFQTTVKVVRSGKEDKWTSIISSMAAGAYFARAGKRCALSRVVALRVHSLTLVGRFNSTQRVPRQCSEEQPRMED